VPKRPKPMNLPITDHAVVRYLERVHGFDIDAIKEQILPDHAKILLHFSNGQKSEINVHGSHTLKVKDGYVITVVEIS